jgi:exodeoxyribonuclease III
MRIMSWNVNGIRAVYKKGALDNFFTTFSPDIAAFQETKCEESQIPDGNYAPPGYHSYFLHATNRKGYSGVAVYTKERPVKVDLGLSATLGKKDFRDDEGRTIILHFEKFIIMNCYWPNGGKSPEHYLYKLEYYQHFMDLAKKYEKGNTKQAGKPVIFLGDINATVADIDLARPKENKDKLGCTEPERSMLAKYTSLYTDTYRYINGDKVKYTWWDMKTRSREKNVGWRIDYIFTSKSIEGKVKNALVHDDFMGSDHCPVSLDIDLQD